MMNNEDLKTLKFIIIWLLIGIFTSFCYNQYISFVSYVPSVCNIDRIHISQLEVSTFQTNYFRKYPLLIVGEVAEWKAYHYWNRNNFSSFYGDVLVQIGSESSITFGGGRADSRIKIKDLLSDIISTDDKNSSTIEKFTFDTKIIDLEPKLKSEFKVPLIFSQFDSKKLENQRRVNHILSIGPANTGLPFHSHGETWLGVIKGSKEWYLYPPGISLPIQLQAQLNHFGSLQSWISLFSKFVSPLPMISLTSLTSSHSTPDILDMVKQLLASTKEYQPLFCTQEEGDILYLPAGWAHMTNNRRETIAIGGQEVWDANGRYLFYRKVWDISPRDFDALKGMSVALLHLAFGAKQRQYELRHGTKKTYDYDYITESLVALTDRDFDKYFLAEQSSYIYWAILYVPLNTCKSMKVCTDLIDVWNEFSVRYRNTVNVVVMDVEHDTYNDIDDTDRSMPYIVYCDKSKGLSDSGSDSGSGRGGSDVYQHSCAAYAGDIQEFGGIDEYIQTMLRDLAPRKAYGETLTLNGLDKATLRKVQEATSHTRKAIALRPSNPEVRGLLLELLLFASRYDKVQWEVRQAEAVYDSLVADSQQDGVRKLSNTTLSSAYFTLSYSSRIALQEIYGVTITRVTSSVDSLIQYADNLNEKSLLYNSMHVPSLINKCYLLILKGQYLSAKQLVQDLRRLKHQENEDLDQIATLEKTIKHFLSK